MEPWLKPGIRTREFAIGMVRPYFGRFVVLMLVGIVASTAGIANAYVVRTLVNTLAEGWIATEAAQQALMLVAGVTAIELGGILLWQLSGTLGRRVRPDITRQAKLALFEYSRRHSHRYWNDHFAGALANKISTAGKALGDVFDMVVWDFTVQIVIFASTIAFFFWVHPSLALIGSLLAAILFGFLFLFTNKVRSLAKTYADMRSLSHGKVVDSVTNIWNIISFTGGMRERAMLDAQFRTEQRAELASWSYRDHLRGVQMFVLQLAFAGFMAYTVYLWADGLITVGDIAVIFTLTGALLRQVREFSHRLPQFMERGSDIQDALDTLVVPYDIEDTAGAVPLVASSGAVEFAGVDFRYREGLPLVFEGLSLAIPAGQRVGLVGVSGAGKTTLVALIQRLYDLSGGAIRIDGQDISGVTLDSLRQAIAVVPQDPVLFHRSLWDNIGYGRPDATHEQITEAAKRANAHDFIERIPEGYDAKVGERGVKLSGGQRQRVAIARAILKDAPILILDEATSALDSESEALIQDALTKLMHGRTTLVIAHRLSTLRELDRILVFEAGRVVEDGTHEALLQREGGVYRGLWERQAGGFIDE